MGLDKDKLLQSLAYYESLIYKQKEEFTVTLKNQILKQVDGPKAELQKLDSLREENLRKIETLKTEIDSIEDRKASLISEIEVLYTILKSQVEKLLFILNSLIDLKALRNESWGTSSASSLLPHILNARLNALSL